MSKKPIKSSLFRFVTLRSPQAIEDKENAIGFIMPDTSVTSISAYYLAVAGVAEGDDAAKRTALEGADSNPSFNLVDGKVALKNISSDLYSFSSWLMRNKNNLSYASVASNLPSGYLEGTLSGVELTSAKEAQVWDNLLYQTINKTSVSLREAFIQMLVANQFVKAFKAYHTAMTANLGEGEIVLFTDQDEKEFIKRANASVVIEKKVLLSSTVETVEAVEELPDTTRQFLRDELRASLAEENIRSYRAAIDELQKEEAIYNQKNQEAYDTALATHQAAVKTELDSVKVVDATTGEISYPEADLPKFTYDAPSLNFQDNSGEVFAKAPEDPDTMLSSETVDLLDGKEFESDKSFSDIYKTLNDCILFEEDILSKRNQNPKRTFSIGGSTFSLTPLDLVTNTPYCYAGVLKRGVKISAQRIVVDMQIFTDRSDSYITSASFSLVHDGTSTAIATTGSSLINNDGKKVLYRFLFDNTATLLDGVYTFSGTLNFANGDAVDFSSKVNYFEKPVACGHISEYFFEGCGNIQGAVDDPVNTPVTKPSLKGVFNLGIADYRRVEQEVCCYVPGEVSHIENILAREYKEKSTRSLVSSEATTEQTSERELEQLTDTTSTERNELQNEVSSVVDQQNSQNFGATTSVSIGGSKFRFGASASYGASSSNSTSLSNSEAQTYAQDITERALERVVEKVSTKRTTRILREFEENNKHGFDNTKGEKHVTGVYRWIDKVYENQIVNYGKRLMYEFAIPEPSRFLKEALLQGPTTDKTDDGLITPTEPDHPATLNPPIKGAKDLTASNYQAIASLYNAEVSPKPKDIISTAASFSFTTPENHGHEWEEVAAESKDVEVPEGYKTDSTKIGLHYTNERGFGTYVLVGSKKFSSSTVSYTPISEYTEVVPVSFSTTGHHAGSVNVEIRCKLSNEGLEQWQNETYNAIMNAYYDRVNEYNDFKRSQEDIISDTETERLQFNPAFNRSMERREFKRLAIELLIKSTNIEISKNNFVTVDGKPQIDASDDFEKQAAVVKFFEQAFDWEIMAYQLYPYYYADKKDWNKLIVEKEDADPIFQAFLQSGMSRMVVPVRPGFETAVNWYTATGEIWNGQGLVTDINDELYLSVVEEMLEPVGEPVGQPWKTQVPTSLTIVQAKSALLEEEGLPCDPDCGNNTTITGSDLVISGGEGSNASDGIGVDIVGVDNDIV